MNEGRNNELKTGSVYAVTVDGEEITGAFLGYVMIGTETALVLKDEEGKVYVPSASITIMRLVQQAPEEGPESPKDVYYG